MANKQSIFIIENNEEEAKSLAYLISSMGYKPVTYFTCAEDFLNSYQDDPGCLIIEMCMPHISGLELQEMLIQKKNTIPIIFVSAYYDISMVVRAIKKGATDFFPKPLNSQTLMEAINYALKYDFSQREKKTGREKIMRRIKQLTLREIEIMDLIVKGKSTKEIAKNLNICNNTIEVHRSNIMKKMNTKTTSKLVSLILTNLNDQEFLRGGGGGFIL